MRITINCKELTFALVKAGFLIEGDKVEGMTAVGGGANMNIYVDKVPPKQK